MKEKKRFLAAMIAVGLLAGVWGGDWVAVAAGAEPRSPAGVQFTKPITGEQYKKPGSVKPSFPTAAVPKPPPPPPKPAAVRREPPPQPRPVVHCQWRPIHNPYWSPWRPAWYDPYPYSVYYPSYPSPWYPPYVPPYYYGVSVIPPAVIPPGALYGPRPIMEMMGVEHWFQPQAPIGPASPPVVPPAPRPEPAPKPPVVRKPLAGAAAEPGGTSQAWKWLGYGDAHFAAEKYDEALRRYQRAAEAAPKLADTHFRQGFALAVLGQYAAAAAAFKRGLELNPAWPKSKFRLAELYDGNELAKTAHLDALARAAEEEPRSGEKFFIFGVWLHFDGQAEKARTAFQRAAQLAQGEQPHLSAFLGKQNCIPGTRTDIDNLEKIL